MRIADLFQFIIASAIEHVRPKLYFIIFPAFFKVIYSLKFHLVPLLAIFQSTIRTEGEARHPPNPHSVIENV